MGLDSEVSLLCLFVIAVIGVTFGTNDALVSNPSSLTLERLILVLLQIAILIEFSQTIRKRNGSCNALKLENDCSEISFAQKNCISPPHYASRMFVICQIVSRSGSLFI